MPSVPSARPTLEPGTLWPALQARAEHALRCGALEPIATERDEVEEAGIRFVVRVLEHLERKVRAALAQARTGSNPFLSYSEDLFVADVSQTHLCLLNTHNVLEHHLLLMTRAFEDQDRGKIAVAGRRTEGRRTRPRRTRAAEARPREACGGVAEVGPAGRRGRPSRRRPRPACHPAESRCRRSGSAPVSHRPRRVR